MTSLLVSLIMSFALPMAFAGWRVTHAVGAQEAPSSFCGRVVEVSCKGPSSAVTLLLADPWANVNRRIIIPAEHRHHFGLAIEARYDQQVVCVASAPAAGAVAIEPVLVRDPSELVVKGTAQASIAVPDDVARTCDPDVRLPTATREAKPQYTAEAIRAKVRGSVFLRGVVDRYGTVREVHVVQSLEPSLDAAARAAFAQWAFQPATRRGEPVSIAITVQMAFTLR